MVKQTFHWVGKRRVNREKYLMARGSFQRIMYLYTTILYLCAILSHPILYINCIVKRVQLSARVGDST